MPYLTINEAAQRAGVSVMTIRRRIKDGALREHAGQKKRLLSSELDALYNPQDGARPVQPCRVIAVANQKGGVGKTTTVANLSAVLASDGYRVLAVDCDPQGSLTKILGAEPTELQGTLYNVLMESMPLPQVVIRPVMNLDTLSLVGGNIRLAGAERELLDTRKREERLARGLQPYLSEYDFIFLDAPPNLGLLTVNVLEAASEIILPVDMSTLALMGMTALMETIRVIQDDRDGVMRVRPLFSKVDRTNMAQDVIDAVTTQFGHDVFSSRIRNAVRVREAQGQQLPISVFRASDPIVSDYKALAEEIANG